jgi:hypothetical protein
VDRHALSVTARVPRAKIFGTDFRLRRILQGVQIAAQKGRDQHNLKQMIAALGREGHGDDFNLE